MDIKFRSLAVLTPSVSNDTLGSVQNPFDFLGLH